jgi:hypothetical protein
MGVNAPVKTERNWLALDKDDYVSTQTSLRIAVVGSIACALVVSLCQRLAQLFQGVGSNTTYTTGRLRHPSSMSFARTLTPVPLVAMMGILLPGQALRPGVALGHGVKDLV